MSTPPPALPGLPRVAVVDDEESLRALMSSWLTNAGYHVLSFSSTDEIYTAIDPESVDCIVIDYYFPDSLGSTIHEWLEASNSLTSVVFVSGRVTVTTAVEAIRKGAVDFLEKPLSRERLLEVVGRAVSTTRERRSSRRTEAQTSDRLGALTDREREVCEQLVAGRTSKEIARVLHISSRTVEHHRASLMHKAGVSNVAELMGLLARGENKPDLGP
jgi:two-component system response regulator FixJ